MADRFSPDDLRLLSESEEVAIETRSQTDGEIRRTTIWVVVDGDEVFVRSVRGPRGRWYRDLQGEPEGRLLAGRRALAFRAVAAADPEAIERASRAFEDKYRGDPSTPSMLRAETLPTTLRLVAA